MGERRRERFSPPAVGGSSLLVVFAVLALTVFALLSLSTVRADARLGGTSAQAVTDYYAADCRAQEIFALLRSGEGAPEGVELTAEIIDYYGDGGEVIYTYAVSVSDTQELQVKVRQRGEDWTVLRWQTAPVGDWEFDDTLSVWDGESEF